jgi:hypothetical protein
MPDNVPYENFMGIPKDGVELGPYLCLWQGDLVERYGFGAYTTFKNFLLAHPDRVKFRTPLLAWKQMIGYGTFIRITEIFMLLKDEVVSMLHLGENPAFPTGSIYATQWPAENYMGRPEYRESQAYLRDYLLGNHLVEELLFAMAMKEEATLTSKVIEDTFCKSANGLFTADQFEIVDTGVGKIGICHLKQSAYSKDKYINLFKEGK